MASCSKCGAPRLGVARFCAACGGVIVEAHADEGPPPRPAVPAPVAAAHAPAASLAAPAAPVAPIAPPIAPAAPEPPRFGLGARVLVLWADGNRYPGTVQRASEDHCLVVFSDGQQRWVAREHLTTGM